MNLSEFKNADSNGYALVFADADSRDEAQVNGRWIKCADPVEIRA